MITYNTNRLRISWSPPVCLSLRLAVPLKLLPPLSNVPLGLMGSIQKIQIQAMYTGLFEDPQAASKSVCHLASGESTAATSSVTRWTGFWSFYIQITHLLPPLASLLWFYSIVTTLSQLFFPYGLDSFSKHSTSLHKKACLTANILCLCSYLSFLPT